MKNTKVLAEEIKSQKYQERLKEIYVDEGVIAYQNLFSNFAGFYSIFHYHLLYC